MKNLLTLCLMILTFVSYSQTPKYITVKQWKNGVLVSTKSYPLVNKVEVTQVKYVPVKSKQKVKVVKLVDTLQVEKLVVDNRKVDSLNAVINGMSNEFAKVNTQKGTYTLEKNQGTVVVEEKVSNNQIIGRTFSADVKPQVKERTVEVFRPKTVQWYIGPNFTSNVKQPFLSFGASVLRKSLSDNLLQISIGTTVHEGIASPTPYFGFGGYFKIK
jgi:hypothetical protein